MTALCSSYLFLSRNNARSRSLRRNVQVIERGNGIGFCPKTYFARILQGVVGSFDLFGPVIVAREFVAHGLHAKLMPDTGRHLEVCSCKLAPSSIDNVVQAVIVLQSVGADDVVIIRLLQTKDKPACLIDTPGDRFEFDA